MRDVGTGTQGMEYAKAAGIVALATGLCLALRQQLAVIDVSMILLLGVVAVAGRYRRGPSLLASVLSIAALNFFFVPPYYTLNVFDTGYYLTFGVMLVVALAMSRLTARIREEREAAAVRAERAGARYAMQADLAAAPDLSALGAAITEHLGRTARGRASIVFEEELADGDSINLPEHPPFDDAAVRVAAEWAHARLEATGWGTSHGREATAMVLPLHVGAARLGLVVIQPSDPSRELTQRDLTTLNSLVSLASAALERRVLAQQSEQARREGEAERLRTALLSSLSHDLRTPLAGIEGAASSLLEDTVALPGDRRELLEGIVAESRRMTRLVGNLLDMVRVETGLLAVRKSWQPLEEALGVALLRIEERVEGRPMTVHVPQDLPMVPIDELLIENVLINLLENAVRYTPPGTPIDIAARAQGPFVEVEVADHGPGVPSGEEEAVFGRFYRGEHGEEHSADAGAGSGLGLTICRGIITAHGGRIWIEPRAGGGTSVRFTLPLNGAPAEPVPESVSGS